MPRIQTTRVYTEIDRAIRAGYTTVSEQGGARSGKSRNSVIWLLVYLLNHPGLKLSVVRGTNPALRRSILVDFQEVIADMRISVKYNKTTLDYTLANGSAIEFFGADEEQKLRGASRDILYVNEANELKEIEWKQLKMRTRLFTIADYNPSFTDEHWLSTVNADPRTYHFVTTYKDNPFLEQTIIDEIESYRNSNRSLWQIYGLGQQAMIEGLIFPQCDLVDFIPPSARRHHFRAIDFGYENDPTAIEDVFIDGKDVYIDELCYNTHMLTSDIITVFKDNDPTVKTISESADPRLVQEIYRGGVNLHPVVKYPGSVQAGIQTMQSYRFHFTRRSINCWKEAKNYTWSQDKEGRWLNAPVDAFNHRWDGVRYIFMMTVMGGRPKPFNKTRLSNIAY